MRRILGYMLLLAGSSLFAFAKRSVTPEIDPSGAVNALALLSGAVLVIRSRRK